MTEPLSFDEKLIAARKALDDAIVNYVQLGKNGEGLFVTGWAMVVSGIDADGDRTQSHAVMPNQAVEATIGMMVMAADKWRKANCG